MDRDVLGTLFGSKMRKAVVGWLFSHPDEEFYITQIARATGCAASNLSVELRKLAAAGILDSRKVGVQRYFRANPRLPIFDELRSIAVKTAGVADALKAALAPLEGVDVAFIYGSVGAGTPSAESDVDLMVVGSVRFADVIAALEGLRERLGRDISPRVYGPEDLREKGAAGSGFLAEVLAGIRYSSSATTRDCARSWKMTRASHPQMAQMTADE